MTSVQQKSLLPSITNDIFLEIDRIYNETKELNDEALLALHSVFGAPLERALELLEKDCVTLLMTINNTRRALQVFGGRGELYTLFPNINYCPCLAYQHQVLSSGTHVTCKHVLAARIAQIMNRVQVKEVSPIEFARILCSYYTRADGNPPFAKDSTPNT